MVAAAMDRAYEGQGRPRKKKAGKTDLPSHYQFALWSYEEGRRIAVPVDGVRKDKRAEFPLISTTIMNEGTGTETLVWLHFDLDYKRAARKWIRERKLHWPTIAATLAVEAPVILRYLSHVVLSSGGQGLSLALAISPLELIDETVDVQKLAFKVQSTIIRIFNHYGMGADEGARGLKRLMPNMFREDRVVDQAEFVQARIQKSRPRVLLNLAKELRYHAALMEKSKSEREDILWPDIRVEKPLARLYTDLMDSVGPWGSQQLKAQDLMDRYRMAKNTLYKLLSDPPKWLGAEKVSGEGYRLTIRPTAVLSNRAWELLLDEGKRKNFCFAGIQMPEHVEKGERNRWLVSLILASKWVGIGQKEVRKGLSLVIRSVPDWQKSHSLTRGLEATLRSLYRNRSSLKGGSPSLNLPEWWLEALQRVKIKTFSQNFYKKGSLDPELLLPDADAGSEPGNCGAVVLPFVAPSSHAVCGVMPGARGGLGPWLVGETQLPESESLRGESASPVFTEGVNTVEPEIYPAGHAADAKTGPSCDDSGGGNTFAHLSGSALSGAFSTALMKSGLPAAEKARILTEVTSITDVALKERARREWLVRLLKE